MKKKTKRTKRNPAPKYSNEQKALRSIHYDLHVLTVQLKRAIISGCTHMINGEHVDLGDETKELVMCIVERINHIKYDANNLEDPS